MRMFNWHYWEKLTSENTQHELVFFFSFFLNPRWHKLLLIERNKLNPFGFYIGSQGLFNWNISLHPMYVQYIPTYLHTYICTLRDMYVEVQKDEVVPESPPQKQRARETHNDEVRRRPASRRYVCVGGGANIPYFAPCATLFHVHTC